MANSLGPIMAERIAPLRYDLILVCSGSRFRPRYRVKVWNSLDSLVGEGENVLVFTGGCSGVDLQAEQWAKRRHHDLFIMPARWNREGKKAAGPVRNHRMAMLARTVALQHKARLKLASFPAIGEENRGTTSCQNACAAFTEPPLITPIEVLSPAQSWTS